MEIYSNDVCVMTPERELDAHAGITLKAMAKGAIRTRKSNKLVVDMTNVTLGDAASFGAIINCLSQAIEAKGTLVLAAPSEHVLRVIELLRFNEAVKVFATVDEAVEYLETFESPTEIQDPEE